MIIISLIIINQTSQTSGVWTQIHVTWFASLGLPGRLVLTHVYRVAQNRISHQTICNISVTSGLILEILEAAYCWHFSEANGIQCIHCTLIIQTHYHVKQSLWKLQVASRVLKIRPLPVEILHIVWCHPVGVSAGSALREIWLPQACWLATLLG